MAENTVYEEVNVEESAVTKPKKDLTNFVGAGAIGVGAVVLFEGGKWVAKKAKKGIVRLASKIDSERAKEDAEAAEPADGEANSEK